MTRSTPGTLCLRTRRARETLYLNAQSTQETQIKLYEFLKHFWHSNKEYLERSRSSNKEYPVCSGSSNINLFGDFKLLIVKNCDFFPWKFQHKNERPILPLRSGISYKRKGNTVHLWHNIEHALWTLKLEAALFAHFAKIWGYFTCLTK